MFKRDLRYRVANGVWAMQPGEQTTVGKVATIEGVSKSPQLYRIFEILVEDGYLDKTTVKHTNGKDMFVFTRTSYNAPSRLPTFESEGV